jgi:hypothetical protein
MGICCYSICGVLCFNQALSKTLEITLIVLNSISFVLLFLSLVIIKWKELSAANLVFFILMFLISISCLIFSIFIRYWRANNLIKDQKLKTATNLSIAGLTLVVINFIICIIEEIVLLVGFYRVDYPCYSNEYRETTIYRRISTKVDCSNKYSDYYADVITDGQYFIAYATFTYLEVALIFSMIIWTILKTRIRLKLDGPQSQVAVAPSPQMYDPYGRAVVVVQPGDVVMVGGNQYQYNPYGQNQPNIPPPNNQYPGSNDFQIDEKIS